MANWILSTFVVVVVAISSFIPPSACFTVENQFGINMVDFAKALLTRDAEQSQLSEETTADKLVNIIIETLDSDNDGQVALSEARNKTAEFLRKIMSDNEESRTEIIGFTMTLAILIDADDSGIVDRNELLRAASTLLRESGDLAAVKFLILSYHIRSVELGPYDNIPWFEDEGVATVITGLDSDNDGSISNDELMSLQHARKFKLLYSTLIQKANEADQDGDDLLDTTETRRWMELLQGEGYVYVRALYIQGQITIRLGRNIAEQWAAS